MGKILRTVKLIGPPMWTISYILVGLLNIILSLQGIDSTHKSQNEFITDMNNDGIGSRRESLTPELLKLHLDLLTPDIFQIFYRENLNYNNLFTCYYILLWFGIILIFLGLAGLILLFFRKNTERFFKWMINLLIYPIISIIFIVLIKTHFYSASQFIPIFSAIITSSATIKSWDLFCELFITKWGWGINERLQKLVRK